MEIWKEIENYPDYEISSYGRVKSLKWGKTRMLKFSTNNSGYLTIHLRKNGKTKSYLIHRLVANAFIPNPDNKPCIDHIDGNPSNNRVENLRWVTQKENSNNPITRNNIRNSKINVYQGINNPNFGNRGKLNPLSKSVLQFDKNDNFIKKWDSMVDIERELKYNVSPIGACCNQRKYRHTAYGYKWGFADNYEQIPFKVFNLQIYKKKVA